MSDVLQLMDMNLNVVLCDELKHDLEFTSEKTISHCYRFPRSYLTNGSQLFQEYCLQLGLDNIIECKHVVPGSPKFDRLTEISHGYCINDGLVMTGFFLINFVTPRLLANKKLLEEFYVWFEKVNVDWMNARNLKPKVKKPPVLGEYHMKIIGNYEHEAEDEHETTPTP